MAMVDGYAKWGGDTITGHGDLDTASAAALTDPFPEYHMRGHLDDPADHSEDRTIFGEDGTAAIRGGGDNASFADITIDCGSSPYRHSVYGTGSNIHENSSVTVENGSLTADDPDRISVAAACGAGAYGEFICLFDDLCRKLLSLSHRKSPAPGI